MQVLQWLQSDRNIVIFKMALCIAAGVAAVLYRHFRLRNRTAALRAMTYVLVFLAVFSAGTYVRFGNFRKESFVNYHDVYHYYLGSKYHHELGYTNLYRASVLADFETEQYCRLGKIKQLRDLETLNRVARTSVFADAREILAPFTPERWKEFKHDYQNLMEVVPWKNKILEDMGHNATPFWNAWASEVTNLIPTGSHTVMTLVACVDFLLLAIMFAVVAWACGVVPMFICVLMFAVSYSVHAWTIKGSLFRMDWLVTMVIGLCCLKKRYYKTAGVFWAFAALVRVFPAFFIFGMAVKAVVEWIRDRKVPPRYRAFWGSFLVSTTVFVAASVVHAGGTHQWRAFVGKLSMHSRHIAPKRMGFTYAWLSESQKGVGEIAKRDERRAGLFKVALALVVVGAVAWISVRVDDPESTFLGLPLMFFLINVTWYYYVVLLVPAVVFLMRSERIGHLVGLWLLCAYTVAAYVLDRMHGQDLPRNTALSTVLMFYILTTAVLLWFLKPTPRPQLAPV